MVRIFQQVTDTKEDVGRDIGPSCNLDSLQTHVETRIEGLVDAGPKWVKPFPGVLAGRVPCWC